jgi:hypothetical protein
MIDAQFEVDLIEVQRCWRRRHSFANAHFESPNLLARDENLSAARTMRPLTVRFPPRFYRDAAVGARKANHDVASTGKSIVFLSGPKDTDIKLNALHDFIGDANVFRSRSFTQTFGVGAELLGNGGIGRFVGGFWQETGRLLQRFSRFVEIGPGIGIEGFERQIGLRTRPRIEFQIIEQRPFLVERLQIVAVRRYAAAKDRD